jgi:hypothetical protein
MPWRARRKWWAEHANDDALPGPPPGVHRAVFYVLAAGSTITPEQACEDLHLSARTIEKALERAGHTEAAKAYRSLYHRQRMARSGLPPPDDDEIAQRRDALDDRT